MMNCFRSLLLGIGWSFCMGTGMAQSNVTPFPDVWQEIEQEARALMARRAAESNYDPQWSWDVARRIAQRRDRSAIDAIAKDVGELQNVDFADKPELQEWMKRLAAYVAVEIADPEDASGLKSFVHKYGVRGSITRGNIVPTVAIDCYHDDESRDWLLDLALAGEESIEFYSYSQPYVALQLLRGYEPDEAMRSKIELALQEEERKGQRPHRLRISREEALRSLLSSWDYAASLENPADRDRYRAFQSRLWRFYPIRPTGYHSSNAEYAVVAWHILADWQPGDERFVEWIFENPATMLDEARVAVELAHRLTDPTKLQAVAEGDAPQAPFARQALIRFENAKKSPPPPPTQRGGFGGSR